MGTVLFIVTDFGTDYFHLAHFLEMFNMERSREVKHAWGGASWESLLNMCAEIQEVCAG